MSHAKASPRVSWVLGQFETPEQMLDAATKLRESGVQGLDAYAPFPVHGMEEALGIKKSIVPKLVALGAIAGVISAWSLIYFTNVYDWPINVGGRPPNSPLLNVPVTFELGVLFSGLTAFLSVFVLSKLPQLHHPTFEVAKFRSAAVDRFWVSIRTEEDDVGRQKLANQLTSLGATDVSTVEEHE